MPEPFMVVTVDGDEIPISRGTVQNVINTINSRVNRGETINFPALIRRFPEALFIVPILLQYDPNLQDIIEGIEDDFGELEDLAIRLLKRRQ